MSTTHLPPVVTPLVDTKTGLPTIPQTIFQQDILLARSAWIPYTPTTSHLSPITVNDCAFNPGGKHIAFRVGLTGTTDGVNKVTFTLPFLAKTLNQAFVVIIDGATVSAGAMISGDFLTVTVQTIPAAGAHSFLVSGVYEAQ